MLSSLVPAWVSKSSEGPRAAGRAQALEPRPSCPWLYCQFFAPRGLLWVPPTYSHTLEFVITQAEPVRRGPAPPARPPTAQEVCYRRAQQAQRDSATWLQATQQPAEKPSSIHISAPGEKRRIAHVPNPRLAAGKSQGTGVGRDRRGPRPGSTSASDGGLGQGPAGASACLSVRWGSGSLRPVAGGPGAVPSGSGPFLALVLGCWLWRVGGVSSPIPCLSDPEPPSEALTQRSPCDSPSVPAPGLCVLASPGLLGYWRRVARWGPV